VKQRELEMRLQKAPAHPDPSPELEQVPTPAPIAADILYMAHANGDIQGKRVADLGCGTGAFAVGAALLGAASVAGFDLDPRSIELAGEFAESAGVKAEFRACEVGAIEGEYDTVVQNPPFGAQNRHADRPFLEKAVELAPVTYSLHLHETAPFIVRWAAYRGHTAHEVKSYKFVIPHIFHFHSRERKHFDVGLFKIER